jgi:hypothetical protein
LDKCRRIQFLTAGSGRASRDSDSNVIQADKISFFLDKCRRIQFLTAGRASRDSDSNVIQAGECIQIPVYSLWF